METFWAVHLLLVQGLSPLFLIIRLKNERLMELIVHTQCL